EIDAQSELFVAHPHHFLERGVWSAFQQQVFQKKRVQPFKQVFREYYRPTADECMEGTFSRRYAGHQIQPKKAKALLQSRQWSTEYGDSAQKIHYAADIISELVGMYDWFTPAEVEAPTLEGVAFRKRLSWDIVNVNDVPPIVFSETMRDIDLVVSVAHVGGVDPEASHSTIEMRACIVRECVNLLRLTNVTLIGPYAKITGKLANYSVHLGSGVVHGEALGEILMTPIHSGQRGRLFLPFLDEDPRTADVMSKILMFAEDGKLKDPSVLAQLKR
ncbi:MAG: DUF4132 domain-containing protein, partial [Bacilli bacterium]